MNTSPSGQLGHELVGFGGLSVLSSVLNVGLTVALVEIWSVGPEVAFAVGLLTVMLTSFVIMRFVIFKSRGVSVLRQLGLYIPSTFGFRATEYVLFIVVHTLLGTPYQVAVVGILLVSAAGKFFFYRHLVFR